MIIDDKFIEGFKSQIQVLTKLKDSVQGAIDRANQKLATLDESRGKNVEDVLSYPKKPGPADSETGKDRR